MKIFWIIALALSFVLVTSARNYEEDIPFGFPTYSEMNEDHVRKVRSPLSYKDLVVLSGEGTIK